MRFSMEYNREWHYMKRFALDLHLRLAVYDIVQKYAVAEKSGEGSSEVKSFVGKFCKNSGCHPKILRDHDPRGFLRRLSHLRLTHRRVVCTNFVCGCSSTKPHTALFVKQRFFNKYILRYNFLHVRQTRRIVIFFLFYKVGSVLKVRRFKSKDTLKKKTINVLTQLKETDLLHAFDSWKTILHRCLIENVSLGF